jgi:cytochrome b pre-mRNA-processing protein 3
MILFSRTRRREREAAEGVYCAALAAARRPAFYVDCGVPDTLQGRFEMVALNLFPLLHRLMHDPGDDPELARLVAESFVVDMDGALRDSGVSDRRLPKRMNTLYSSFAGRITAYEEALSGGESALAEAIARNVFPDAAAPAHAASLARYAKAAVAAIRAADIATIRSGALPYPELPPAEPPT